MDYQPSTPAVGVPSSSQHHSLHSSFPPSDIAGWNNQGSGMKSNYNQSQWNNSHFPPQPPPNVNFSQPPPRFTSNRPPPPPVMHANSSHTPHLNVNTNRPPPPVNFYHATAPLDVSINRPPPSLPAPPHQFYHPPHQQAFPPNHNNARFNVNHQQLSFNPSYPPSMPPQHNNNLGNQNHQFNDQHKPQMKDFHHEKVDISNLLTKREKAESEMEKKRKLGQQRLTSWLHKIGKSKKKVCSTAKPSSTEVKTGIKVNQYLCKLQDFMASISNMSTQVERLDSSMLDAEKPHWQQECNTIETLKAKHRELQFVLDKADVDQMEKKLCRIKHRKARLKRSRHAHFQELQEIEEARQTKEKEISDWQQRLLSEMKEDLMKKKRKQEMDQTLSEVTKKINDANRLIDTMTALEKLRLIRQDAAKKRGDSDLGESRQSFEQKISDMTRLVRSQLEVYKEEEDKLRGVLRSEQEETSKKEKQLQENKDLEEQRQKNEDLRKMLFSCTDDANVSDPLFPYQQYYMQAERSLPAFVHIRHEWDQYVVQACDPGGSSIPSDWVLPPNPSSSDWATALI